MDAGQVTKLQLPLMLRLKLWISAFIVRMGFRRDGGINRGFLNLLDRKVASDATVVIDNIQVISSDINVDLSRNIWFRLFIPRTTKNNPDEKLPLVIYFHGGGFSAFSPDSKPCDHLCRRLAAKLPAIIASVNHRLAPEYRYPCQYEDGFDALKFINTQNYNILPSNADLNKCFLAGDSSGGNIAHHVTLRACNNSQEIDKLTIAGLILVQPFFGGEERTQSELKLSNKVPLLDVKAADQLWTMLLPEGANRNHQAVNPEASFEAYKDLKNIKFPKTLLIVGGFDPLQDWQIRYAQGLKKRGKQVELINYPNAFHSSYGIPELPEYSYLMRDVKNFVHRQSQPSSMDQFME